MIKKILNRPVKSMRQINLTIKGITEIIRQKNNRKGRKNKMRQMLTIKRLKKMKKSAIKEIQNRVRQVQANLRSLMKGIQNKKAKKIQIQLQNKI